jgi:hypothetical protein
VGTITYVMEIDDWNRTRSHREIACSVCLEEERQEQEVHALREKRREDLYGKAKDLATKRHLDKWLDLYARVTKKEAWRRYTGGSGYPTLGTFYKHVKDFGGVTEYMRWCFSNHFEEALKALAVKDDDVEALLAEREH